MNPTLGFNGPAAKLGISQDCAEREQVLALRGLIGMRVLEHTLQRRHRVDFGLTERCALRAIPPLLAHVRALAHLHIPACRCVFLSICVCLQILTYGARPSSLHRVDMHTVCAWPLLKRASVLRYFETNLVGFEQEPPSEFLFGLANKRYHVERR